MRIRLCLLRSLIVHNMYCMTCVYSLSLFVARALSVRRMIARSSVCALLLLACAGALFPSAVAQAVGISPGTVIIENMTVDSVATREFVLVRSDASQEEQVQIVLQGVAAESVSLVDTTDGVVTLPQGQTQTPVVFAVEPAGLPEGFYDVQFRMAPVTGTEDGSQQGSGIVAGALGVIRFQVTNDEIADFTIANVQLPATEHMMPIGFTYRLENKGNVSARPHKIDVVFVRSDSADDSGDTNPWSRTIEGSAIPFVKGFQTQDVSILTDIQLEAEQYDASFVFYDEDQNVLYQDYTSFTVLPEGSLDQSGRLLSIESDKAEYVTNELAVIRGVFENDGTAGVAAQLVADVSKDGQRLDFIKSDEVFVAAGATAELEVTFRPSEAGTYDVTGHVAYGVNQTPEQSSSFVVTELNSYGVFAGLAAGSLVLIVMVVLVKKRRAARGRSGDPDGAAPAKDA